METQIYHFWDSLWNWSTTKSSIDPPAQIPACETPYTQGRTDDIEGPNIQNVSAQHEVTSEQIFYVPDFSGVGRFMNSVGDLCIPLTTEASLTL